MNLSVFTLIATFLLSGSETPNFYPGYSEARAASKKSGKEMIIFFTKSSCAPCQKAWDAFTKDGQATNQYISTQMDIGDFDGGVFYEMLELETYPSWVVFAPDGIEKERWNGGWKDASGHPAIIETGDANMAIASSGQKTMKQPSIDSEKKSATVNTPVATNNEIIKETSATMPASGFVLQAGYFGSEANAQKMLMDLKSKGLKEYSMMPTAQSGAMFFRIISPVYDSEEKAMMENKKLTAAGIKASIKNMREL